jgi:hypothetical protein
MIKYVVGALLAAIVPAFADGLTISNLPPAAPLAGAELFPCVQAGSTDKCTITQAAAFAYSLLSGDCVATTSGSITCTKTGGAPFGNLATLNAAPAGTLTGATLAASVTASSLTSLGQLLTLGVTGSAVFNSTLSAKGAIGCGTESVADYINVYAYGGGAWITCQADATGVAGTFATRTKNWPGGVAAPIGAIHWGFADMPTASGSPPVWAQYSETRKFPGTTGFSVVNEQDVTNFISGLPKIDPYVMLPSAQLAADLWLASGGGCKVGTPCYNPLTTLTNLSANSAQAAIGILNNGSDFITGIAVQYNALSGVDGKTLGVFAPVLAMATGHALEWSTCSDVTAPYPTHCAANHVAARISAQQGTAATLGQLLFHDSAVNVETATNAEFSVLLNSSDTEGLAVVGDSSGNTPTLAAIGGPAAINVGLAPKGTGTVVINSTPGVTCSGTPTSSFASTKGIVTHC